MENKNLSVYRNMMRIPPEIDKDYLRRILRLPDAGAVREADIVSVEESNTAAAIKLAIKIGRGDEDRIKRLFIKTAKADKAGNAYHKMSMKEARFYEAVSNLGVSGLPVPACRDVFVRDDTGEFLIVLDDISEDYAAPENAQLQDERVWLSCAESLAKLHSAFWNLKKAGMEKPSVVSEERLKEDMADNLSHLEKFLEYAGERFDERTKSIFNNALKITNKRIAEERQRILLQNNVTVINGDSHIYNFMLPVRKNKMPVIVDFQFWGVGYGAGDLAHLTRVGFPAGFGKAEHLKIAERYYRALLNNGVTGYSWKDCYNDYRMNVASMVMIPVWQYSFFNLMYEDWSGDVEALVNNYESLECGELS